MSTDQTSAEGVVEPVNPLSERLFRSAIAAFDLFTLYIGERLGLYRALAEGGPATSSELARRTETNERYVREWLEQQAVSGLIAVDDPSSDALSRRYSLPQGHVEVLVDTDSLNYEAHRGIDIVRAARPLPELVEAFRTGAALSPVPWEPEGRAEFNRARFLGLLGKRWVPSVPRVDGRLRADPPARVADVGCGTGWSSIALATAYPKVSVDGFDLDPDAIARAKEHAIQRGVQERVRFVAGDAAELPSVDPYDMVMIFEALHDMARPVEVLSMARSLLAPSGVALVADERVGERFVIPADEQEIYIYGWSVVSCLGATMGDPTFAATGAVMRPDILRQYAVAAGFDHVEVLSIQDREWRFYLLVS